MGALFSAVSEVLFFRARSRLSPDPLSMGLGEGRWVEAISESDVLLLVRNLAWSVGAEKNRLVGEPIMELRRIASS